MQTSLVTQVTGLANVQTTQLAGFGQQMTHAAEVAETSARAQREDGAAQVARLAQQLQQQVADLARAVQLNLGEVRTTLEGRLQTLQQGNEAKLEQMRATVEEKLQSTLEARLGESFRLVSERLEQVHRGLGEMQSLATGVGDLKRVLTNVKTRGTFGEVQLAALLEQVLTTEQYAANVATRPGSNERVEFAVRLPGRDDGAAVWLPIDAKFPSEDYERLLAAHDAADGAAVETASRALETRIRTEAKSLREKYVEPPYTTDFGILFLPTEGLFAEVLRRPGLTEALNRDLRVVIAGPTTLFAMLNSLQMGFRTLALEKRSAEAWQVLGAVKTEFGKFGDVLATLKKQLATASNTIEQAETRTRQMDRRLKAVEALPVEEAARILPPERTDDG
jgi:DNA recombination protein RmuC